MAEQHSSKSIMWAVIIAAAVLIAIIFPFTVKHTGSAADSANSSDESDVRIQPVAKFELAKVEAPAVSSGPKDGLTVFNSVCAACHATGAAGSPKAGDKAAWAPRIAQGKDVLYKSALGGKNAMPARGGAANLSDDEIKGAVDHLLGLVK
ncbi:MAG: Cytochrome c, class [Proteobacteria bacterium]|nr:Cytochrome c, class [Pseudomonadota bacterium]